MDTTASGAVTATEETGNRAFEVETHGIDHIPEAARRSRPFDLFWIWFGANVIFTYVIDGAIIVGFGLSFWPALAVVLIGNVFYLLVGMASIPGARAGTATLVISRSAFGVLGNAPAAVLSWLTAVGWEAVNIVIGALSLVAIFAELGAGDGAGWKLLALVVIVVLTFGVAVLGHATITLLNKFFSYALGIGTLVLGIMVLPQADLSRARPALAAPTYTGAFLLALVVMAAAPLSWVNTGADYSRYLPRRTCRLEDHPLDRPGWRHPGRRHHRLRRRGGHGHRHDRPGGRSQGDPARLVLRHLPGHHRGRDDHQQLPQQLLLGDEPAGRRS